jgi:solute:Na+ symporter, SSS family
MPIPPLPLAVQLHNIDWLILAASVAICFVPALYYARRSGASVSEYFTSGQSAPWWLIGISMVATTFSTDTPNFVTNLIRTEGVASNWQWWAFALTGMSTVFFFARLWRRSGVLTDLEFYELRYSGKAAKAVRGFRAVYLGLFFNCIIMASVNLAATKISGILFGFEKWETLAICAVINIAFAATSGLWGVLVIDMIQFGIAMTGAFALAYFSLHQPEVGGLNGLITKISATSPETLKMIPSADGSLLWSVMLIPLLVGWWSTWYPGSEPGGGSYIAQRMLAAKSERDALGGTLFFNFAHYVLRPWPWILVGLCSMVIFPELSDIQKAFPNLPEGLLGHDIAYPAMMQFLPSGWLGLMVAGLLAAYVSTIITHLNWGTSYLVHDFYQRFISPGKTDKHYVGVGRVMTALLMLVAGAITLFMETAQENFKLLLQIGAGTGSLYLFRWFWWRINAISEVTAMVASLVVAVIFQLLARQYAGAEVAPWFIKHQLPLGVGITTLSWVIATFVSKPTDAATLRAFYDKVRPAGPGWAKIRAESRLPASPDSLPVALLGSVLGVTMIWTGLIATGSFLYGNHRDGAILGVVFLASSAAMLSLVRKLWAKAASS